MWEIFELDLIPFSVSHTRKRKLSPNWTLKLIPKWNTLYAIFCYKLRSLLYYVNCCSAISLLIRMDGVQLPQSDFQSDSKRIQLVLYLLNNGFYTILFFSRFVLKAAATVKERRYRFIMSRFRFSDACRNLPILLIMFSV